MSPSEHGLDAARDAARDADADADPVAAAQQAVIEALYRTLGRAGRPPHCWLAMTAPVRDAGTLPPRLAHLRHGAQVTAAGQWPVVLVASLEPMRKEWVKDQQSAAGKCTQAALDAKGTGTEVRKAGGEASARARSRSAVDELHGVIRAYRHARKVRPEVKLRALLVAQWWVERHEPAGECARSLAQRLRLRELAT
jgi:hypothetical protein